MYKILLIYKVDTKIVTFQGYLYLHSFETYKYLSTKLRVKSKSYLPEESFFVTIFPS